MATRREIDDPRIVYAINWIIQEYDHHVSIKDKATPWQAYGRTTQANAVPATIARFQGFESNETFATANTIDSLVSDAGGNAGRLYEVTGMQLAAGVFERVTQQVTCTGTTAATLSTPLIRVDRVRDVTPGSWASVAGNTSGNVYVYDSTEATGVTSGAPDVASSTKARIDAARSQNQSEKATASTASDEYLLVTEATLGLTKGNSSTVSAEAYIEVRTAGGPWRPVPIELTARAGGSQARTRSFDPVLIVPPDSDVRMMVEASTTSVIATGQMNGWLGRVI